MSTTRSYRTGDFFHNLVLVQFDPKKVMFYTLVERGRQMLKKKRFISARVAGLAFTVTNKYHTKDNLYKVIAKSNNSSSYIKQLLRNSGI